jgi:alpha-glucosidase
MRRRTIVTTAALLAAAGLAATALAAPGGPPPPPVYLSDLQWTSATNSWGPVERDMSNGENAAGDGNPITLNGRVYRKGLGVVPHSNVTYELGGEYDEFCADAGIDDEVDHRGNGGTVVFRVLVDGEQRYDSDVVYGTTWGTTILKVDTSTRRVCVDIDGAERLELVTTPGWDGFSNDHADWADARVCRERCRR